MQKENLNQVSQTDGTLHITYQALPRFQPTLSMKHIFQEEPTKEKIRNE